MTSLEKIMSWEGRIAATNEHRKDSDTATSGRLLEASHLPIGAKAALPVETSHLQMKGNVDLSLHTGQSRMVENLYSPLKLNASVPNPGNYYDVTRQPAGSESVTGSLMIDNAMRSVFSYAATSPLNDNIVNSTIVGSTAVAINRLLFGRFSLGMALGMGVGTFAYKEGKDYLNRHLDK